jgi:RNA polymerase sigma-70 factor (ECF subfamily)
MNRRKSDFARLYDEHVWRVYGFIAYRVRDRHLAEDLTQTTFERALRAWSRFDAHRASESTWLLTIARNLLIDHYRRDRSGSIELIDEHAGPIELGPEERFSTATELVEALQQLSDRDREVLALRFGGDLNGPEIAVMLDLSLANVQQIISRSLRKLRTLLEDEGSPSSELAR